MTGKSVILLASLVVLLSAPTTSWSGDKLVIHEWGTFTSLQDDQGRGLPGINVDDEPLPAFVHNLNPYLPVGSPVLDRVQMKAAPSQHPYVTMRLETPVVYFHPPRGTQLPMSIDLDVRFRQGWLTEHYPKAEVDAPGLRQQRFDFGQITPWTEGSLSWNGLQVGERKSWPETDACVWTTPRNVAAAPVVAENGEAEQYLFYRGIGNLEAPLSVSRDNGTGELVLRGNFSQVLTAAESVPLGPVWLVDIRADGTSAFRPLPQLSATADTQQVLARTPAQFLQRDYGQQRLMQLREEMHRSLTQAGLFADEATAMLDTWQRAYFQSPGLRVFFAVPPRWTEHYLPLSVSKPADITRVMIGRVELVSDGQRDLLQKLSTMELGDLGWLRKVWESPYAEAFQQGRSDIGDLAVVMPPEYRMYHDLGRFRNALIVAEEKRTRSPVLRQFIDLYRLEPFQIPEPSAVRR